MSKKKFFIALALWSLLPLLAICDVGGIVGFIMIWAVIIIVFVPLGFLVQFVGAVSVWAKALPIGIGIIIATMIAYAILKRLLAAFLAFKRGEMMLARGAFIRAYGIIACLSVPLLSLESLARQWP